MFCNYRKTFHRPFTQWVMTSSFRRKVIIYKPHFHFYPHGCLILWHSSINLVLGDSTPRTLFFFAVQSKFFPFDLNLPPVTFVVVRVVLPVVFQYHQTSNTFRVRGCWFVLSRSYRLRRICQFTDSGPHRRHTWRLDCERVQWMPEK